MVSIAGVVLAGAGLLVMGYMAPGMSYRRTLDAQCHADDRFSDRMHLVPITVEKSGVPREYGSSSIPLHPAVSSARFQREGAPAGRLGNGSSSALRKRAVIGKEVGMAARTQKKQASVTELASALSQRAEVHGRLTAQAKRRVTVLALTLAMILPIVIILALTETVSWWWLTLPVAMVAVVLVQGRFAAAAGRRELSELNAKIAQIRARVGSGRREQTPTEKRASRQVSGAEDEAVAAVAPVIAPRKKSVAAQPVAQPAAHISTEVETPVAAESETETVAAESAGWEPRPLPKPLYTMRATQPRREVMDLQLEQPGTVGRVPVRPVRARRPATGALSSAEVAAGAALEFDVDSVIEQRRAAAS
ncbi:hypothetical protein [Boudabousia marimammalium]|uniref:Uncharacterized protein n=1 Tax=Boudabousia marimammalium TaxID=156892 RepID=A0A1Q5PL53_9ACTO|nr:hypothetical protein [Boudabousia marimammalium]OKL47360.1 hypothetical protein BM477_06745 [Boudabousia marimammalium]